MKRVNLIATACVTALLAALTLTAAAQSVPRDERTFLTFSNSVELPGITLQPGTYLFRLHDSQANRHIVQVYNQDETQLHATILAVAAEREEVEGESVVTFRETAEGGTPAVQFWYYPGDKIGHEFVYPKDQAVQIAQRTGQNVLAMDGDIDSSDTKVTSIGPNGQETPWSREGAPQQTAENESGAVEGTAGLTAEAETEDAVPQPESSAAAGQQEGTVAESGTAASGTAGQQEGMASASGMGGEQAAVGTSGMAASGETIDPESESANAETETPPAEPQVTERPEQEAEGMTAAGSMTATESEQEHAAAGADHRGAMGTEQQQAATGTAGVERDAANQGVDTQGVESQRAELPATASPLPLTGLIGLLSLGGALALRRARR